MPTKKQPSKPRTSANKKTGRGYPKASCCASLLVKPDDVLICMIDEWGNGEKEAFDCHITSIRKDGVDVCYLSGYRSRNDFVPWADVVAREALETLAKLGNEPNYENSDGNIIAFNALTQTAPKP